MDISKMREEFSSSLLKLDELNKKLIDQISDLQAQLEEQRNHNTTTKELLLKTQNKLIKTDEENRQHIRKVAHYKSKLKQTHDKTKEAERGWISLTKYLKSFHNNCTCQSKGRTVIEPPAVQTDLTSPTTNNTTTNISHTSNTNSTSNTTFTSPVKPTVTSVDQKLFRNPKSPKLSRKRSSTNLKVSPAVLSNILRTSPKHRVSKLKRTKPTSPKSVKKLCLSASPGAGVPDNRAISDSPGIVAAMNESLVLYAADSQFPEENNLSVSSDISLVHVTSSSPDNLEPESPGIDNLEPGSPGIDNLEPRSPGIDNLEPGSPGINNLEPVVCPDSPDSPILNLSVNSPTETLAVPCKSSDNGNVAAKTSVTETKQFGLLTECKNNISISEEKLGFSLPENMTSVRQDPKFDDDAETIVETSENEDDVVNDDDVDFKISRPSNSDGKPSNNVKTSFKYKKVVRKKEERAKLAASSCPSCYRYYKACGLDEEEIAKLIGDVSRHRHQHGQISNTPPSLWDLTINHAPIPTEPATQRKPRKNRYITRRDS